MCKAGKLAAELPAPDGALLASLLSGEPDGRGRHVPASVLARAVRADGHLLSATTVKDHRAGRCACPAVRTDP